MNEVENIHRPVLRNEVLQSLDLHDGSVVIDATLGPGGHSEAILQSVPTAIVIGIDQDASVIAIAVERLKRFGTRFQARCANFAEIRRVANESGIERVDGIIGDLGVSSMQLDSPERGFSFRFDASLDMRMDQSSDVPTASELLEILDEEELADIIYRYGEERRSRRIARKIIERREQGAPVRTTADLANLIQRAIGRSPKDKIHPATRTFQALRIAVNDELGNLERFIENSVSLLKADGRLCVISFHSLEDRIVKQAFQRLSGKCQCPPRIPKCICGASRHVEVLTRKPIIPTNEEMIENPRSRSAKLRVCRKLSEN